MTQLAYDICRCYDDGRPCPRAGTCARRQDIPPDGVRWGRAPSMCSVPDGWNFQYYIGWVQ